MASSTRICPICEAACNLAIDIRQEGRGDRIISCRSHDADTFSQGHVCPKGVALGQLDGDPDRLRVPLVRDAHGELQESTWGEAFERICVGLNTVRATFGNNAVATYIGNPTAHNVGLSLGLGAYSRALGSKNVFSAGSVDQLPKQLACELMFGDGMAIPVPDIERTELLVMLGANPIVSNGSLWVVPGIRKKIAQLKQRGGRLVVIDPRRTETAKVADIHHFIQPGSDAWLLAALCKILLDRGCRPSVPVQGFVELENALQGIDLAQAAVVTGISVTDIQRLAEDLSSASSAAVYGRVGTTLQRFGTLTSFLIEVVNILTGNLDVPGGALFPQQAFAGPPSTKSGLEYARYHSRVSGYPEVLGQMPVACLAEEIETPGTGQIRAMVVVAGNPLVSNPESTRLAEALDALDFMVAVDIYHNETTSRADVILPGTSPFEDVHYDSFLGAMTFRNTARYSPRIFPCGDRPDEWQIMLHLAYGLQYNKVPDEHELAEFEDQLLKNMALAYGIELPVENQPAHSGVERVLDLGIRMGPWGDGFGDGDGLNLQKLKDHPNSIDMGPLRPRLDEIMNQGQPRINLAPEVLLTDLARLPLEPMGGLRLIGRRNIQTNNSWLHNLPLLSAGPDRAVLEMNTQDALTRQIRAGDRVRVSSAVGDLHVEVVLTEDLMPGTVCLPHGFSEVEKPRQHVARKGVNSNVLAAADYVDRPSATVALNGIAVTVTPAG